MLEFSRWITSVLSKVHTTTSSVSALAMDLTNITQQAKPSQNVLNVDFFSVNCISVARLRMSPKYVLERLPYSKDLLSVAEGIKKWVSADYISRYFGFLSVWELGWGRGQRVFSYPFPPIIFQLNLSRDWEFYFPNMNHLWSNKLITHPSCPTSEVMREWMSSVNLLWTAASQPPLKNSGSMPKLPV